MPLGPRFTPLVLLVALAVIGRVGAARADDTADEADLQFQLGAEAYQRQDFRAALEHFHASNRLVPNRNVLFNIGRTYETLADFPAAYRYYDQALEGEVAPEIRADIEVALTRIAAEVALLSVATEPPGATLFIDRRDLGPRGTAPRRLALPPGSYRVIAVLPGYEPEVVTVAVGRGEALPVRLELRQILGTVRVGGTPQADVRVDDPSATVACVTPCSLDLVPGRHHLFVSRGGYRQEEVPVEVQARRATQVRPELSLRTGTVVVSTDEPGALVELDGVSRGFSPTVVTLPIGEHQLRVSRPGFVPVERPVLVSEEEERHVALALVSTDEVAAASRVVEDAAQAPSSVTIIPRAELRAFAYPTLAESIRGVSGVYQWDDRAYVTPGIRGLGRLGSYGNRVLVLQDGMPTNDDWVGASYLGYDAMTDLGDVERVEVVRGPGSALYGTGAFSGVINVVPREVTPGVEAAIGTELDGVARARARGDAVLGKHASFWTSAAVARGQGNDYYFPERADETPANAPPGHARGVDGFRAGTTRGEVAWRWLSLHWFLHRHQKVLPGHYDTVLGDERTFNRDTRGIIELRSEPVLTDALRLASRLYLNHYAFRGEYVRPLEEGGFQVDAFEGRWVGMEHRVLYSPSRALRLTLGGDVQHHYRVEQRGWDQTGEYLDLAGNEAKPFQVGAAYGIVDAEVMDGLRFSAGARLDSYSTWGSTLNPRTAVILRPYAAGNTKVLFGRAFRAPSVYELYYNDDGRTQVPPPEALRPEMIYSGEVEHSHRFSPTVLLTGAVHANYVENLIDTTGGGTTEDPLYFTNADSPLVTAGGEVVLRRDWRQGLMGQVGYTVMGARFLASKSGADLLTLAADPALREVSNVPTHTATFKGAAPLLVRGLTLATRLVVESGRWDRNEAVGSDPQRRTDPYALWDLVLTGREATYGFEYALGVYNLCDWRYRVPVSGDLPVQTMPQSGRTVLVTLGGSMHPGGS